MKTLFINASPKLRFSASSYLLRLQRLFIRGTIVSKKLHNKNDYAGILEELSDADTIVFCLPLYVDGVPSHVLPFLKKMEDFCTHNNTSLNVYCIANNGFIEGRQNKPLMQVFQNFCARSGLHWCGGIGVGGGVMLNVTQILFAVNAAVFIISLLVNCIFYNAFPAGSFQSFAINTALLLFLNAGVLYHVFRMGRSIQSGNKKDFGSHYTRIMLPSFLFIILADAFFMISSVFSGGIFRGWLARK